MAAAVSNVKETKGEAIRQSRTGKRPIDLPKGVSAKVAGDKFEVTGPKGTLTRPVPPNVKVVIEGAKVSIVPTVGGSDGARYQGLARALFASMAKGAAEGVVKELELVGTGYRVEVKGTTLNFSLGFSHPVSMALPKGVTAVVPPESKGTLLVLTGNDKELMGQLASKIRDIRPPEPYGGKGVRYKGEKVRQKAGKSGGKGK
ncbi:MAG: 50S ribosomal protein L6 [Deltaproteobacteria bacterium]|nr:50S ribosomal protein L6 [Deltaproteobacteria bacterium]